MPLFLVATPIGNLEDITLRALRVLREVDLIACEDTRVAGKLLSRFDIEKRTVSYHEHNEKRAAPRLAKMLREGASIALLSDAGTPLVSDPGYRLVQEAVKAGVAVVPVPGASSALAALSVSGLPSHRFAFLGFAPRKPGKMRNFLARYRDFDGSLVLFEAPGRVGRLLEAAAEVFGGDAGCAVCRELTKLHEEVLRGTAGSLAEEFAHKKVKGEVTVVLAPGKKRKDGPAEAQDGSGGS